MSYNPVLKAGQATSANSNPVVIASDQSPIPVVGTVSIDTTGLATATNQTSEITQLTAILNKIIAAPATESTVAAIESTLSSIPFATQATLASILAKIIAAPSTEAKQDTEISHLSSIDTKLTSPISVTGTVVVDETNLATSAKQDTGNTSLATIAGKDFATQTSLAALISANHTDLSAILTKLTNTPATTTLQTAGNISLASIDSKLTNPLPISGTVNTGLTQPLTDTQLRATPVPVSGTVTVTGGGDASAAKQDIGNASLSSIDSKLTNPLPVSQSSQPLPTGAATAALQTQPGVDIGDVTINNASGGAAVNIQDGGNSITVDGSVTANAGTNLNTSALALESGGNLDAIKADLDSIDAGIPTALGQTTMANSMPVTIASNQSPIPVTGSFGATDNTQLFNNTISAIGAQTGLDTTGYSSIVTQLSGVWEGTILFEGSNDNTIWNELLVLNVNELSMQDIISANGTFQLKTTTKYIRLNVQVLQTGNISALILGRISQGISGADLLSLAMDKTNMSPLYTQDINGSPLKDINGAAIISDAPAPITLRVPSITNAVSNVIDTIGYQSASIQVVGSLPGNWNFQESNDNITWSNVIVAYCISGGIGVSLVTNFANASSGIYVINTVGRYLRMQCTSGSAGFGICIVYLRASPINMSAINIANINGTAPVGVGAAGYMPVAGQHAQGTVAAVNPVLIAGADNLNSAVRRLLTDSSGRLFVNVSSGFTSTDASGVVRVLGGLPAGSSNQNVASLAVQDLSQFEGQSFVELLGQILLEIRISNQYMYELPRTLQRLLNDTTKDVGTFGNEPFEYRNEQSIFNN